MKNELEERPELGRSGRGGQLLSLWWVVSVDKVYGHENSKEETGTNKPVLLCKTVAVSRLSFLSSKKSTL